MRFAPWLLLLLALAAAPAKSAAYEARVVRVIDGDTLDLVARLPVAGWTGMVVEVPERVRLAGIDAPETRRPACAAEARAGAAATAALTALAPPGSTVLLTAVKPRRDRWGRLVAQIRAPAGDLAATLLAAGHARRYDGGRRRSWCAGPT